MLGRDLTAKQLNRRVCQFDDKLKRLQQEAEDLAVMIDDYAYNGEDKHYFNYDEYVYYFRQIQILLDELSNFDLEDSIEEARY